MSARPTHDQQLGGIHPRTVRRLIDRGDIQSKKIGRRLLITAESVRAYIDTPATAKDNPTSAGHHAQERSQCHTNAKILRFGGSASPTQVAKELDALLRQPTA